jgi:hypothetical protein
MATEVRSSTKSAAPPKSESFVVHQLARVRWRVRLRDLGITSLVLAIALLAYGLIMSLADRFWDLPAAGRLTAWLVFMLSVGCYLGFAVHRLCVRRVNPLYLAWQLERTVPEAKNSVINWLELRDEPLAPVIRGSLSRHAARDLKEADPEKAVHFRPLFWLGGVAGVLMLIQAVWLFSSPAQVMSLLKRAFIPFERSAIAARTELTLIKPESGEITVLPNQPVLIRVKVQGYVPPLNQPDSLKLHFRNNPNEDYEPRNLQKDVDGTWTTVILADQVRNGFYYKITGGDAQLPMRGEFRVIVRPIPQVQSFDLTYHYRPYVCKEDVRQKFDLNKRLLIKELRGTETTLVVNANRPLKQCVLEFKHGTVKQELTGTPVSGDPQAWAFKFVLDKDGDFRVLFKTTDAEDYADRDPYRLEVVADMAPTVTIKEPKDVTLPANGTLQVVGLAEDDFGVKSMQLRLKVVKAPSMPDLKGKAYRQDTDFKLPNGKYPRQLDYADFVALDKLQTVTGEPFPLAAGMELEYWLEARDNCDYPDASGNLGKSERYKLTITEPASKQKATDDRQKIEQKTQAAQQQQDKKLDDQKLQAKMDQLANSGDPKDKDDLQKLQQQVASDSQKVADALKKQQDKDQSPGQSKEAENNNGSSKGQGPNDNAPPPANSKDRSPDAKDDSSSKDKDAGNQGQGNESGQGKDQGQQQQNGSGQAKDQGKPNEGKPGTAKDNAGQQDNSPAASKDGQGQEAPREPIAGAKDKGKEPGKEGQAGKAKDGTTEAGGAPNANAQTKDGGDGQKGTETASAKGANEPPAANPPAANSHPKTGSNDSSPSEAKNAPKLDKVDVSQNKGPGDQQAGGDKQQLPGEVKGPSTPGSSPKDAKNSIVGPDVSAKPAEAGPKDLQADKAGPPKTAQDAADAKGDGNRKDATLNDVAKLTEQLGDPKQGGDAEKGLENIKDQAADPKVSQAAAKALQAARDKQAAQPAQVKPGSQDVAQGADKNQGQPPDAKEGPASAAKAGQPNDPAGKQKGSAKEGSNKETANAKPKKSGSSGSAGTSGLGKFGSDDPSNPAKALTDADKHAGDLQLESLKKQIDELRKKFTPEVKKDLGWDDRKVEEFLRQAMADAMLRAKMKDKDKLPLPGSVKSLLPSAGPRVIVGDPDAVNPSTMTQTYEPPPEVREAQRIFLNPPAPKKK